MRALVLAVLLSTLAPGATCAAELGRLFLTPAERAAIDDAQRGRAAHAMATSPAPDAAQLESAPPVVDEPPAESVTVNGYIARSAGAATVWVNGRDSAPGKLSAPARDGRRVKVPLAGGGGQVALKPGQSFDPGSRQVSDAYQQRPPSHQ